MRDTFPLFRTVNLPLTALLLASTALVGFSSANAQELPTGGSVASGGVTISQPSASQLAIKQSTNSAIVNWQSFSIGAGAGVDIDQPNSSSVMLNRVTGSTKSTIAGQLNANGQVFLVNPNGIAISKTGKVSAAGFVGSSLDIDDQDFKAGKLTFKGKGASASVSNEGSISIGSGGYAALIGGSVDNSGTISVPLGKVGLGSGEKATLDLSGDGFLQVAVPTEADGSGALVGNSGVISADGGRIEIKAAAAKEAARQAVNMSGLVEARTVSGQSGEIVLGGDQGSVEISGTLDASAKAGGQGGKVTVTGRKLKLKGATVDASGKNGGGTVRIGGDKQGSGTLQRAETTEIDTDSKIGADATGTGDGGTIIVWSDEWTGFAGKLSARGGDNGGDGGFVEVSGKQRLDFSGSADLRARLGDTGDLLLDPYNVIISSDADTGGFTANSNDSVINVNTLQNQLALANVTISTGSGGSQAGDITIAAPINWGANTLTLDAYHSIVFNAGATIGGVGGLTLITNHGGTGGVMSYALGASVTFTGTQGAQALSINGQSYTLIYDVNGLQAINNGLSGRYALANTIDASATYNWNGVKGFIPLGTDGNTNILNGGNGFNGTFDGLGNTIDYLRSTPGGANYAGLFGFIGGGGAVRNVGLVDASVMASYETGAIAGWNKGSISGVWASGQIHGAGSTGGLVGQNDGSITRSFSTVGVNARDNNTVGGLVGANTSSGTISQSYAYGWVLGSSYVGGLVGLNMGSISDAYSTGPASGTNGDIRIGGLVGYNLGSVTNGAFDMTTSGLSNAFGSGSNAGSVIGLTTADFQNGAANGLSAAFGGGSGGLYPYLKSFYPNGVQAISGIAYKDSGVTPLSSGTRQPYYVKNPGLVTAVANGVDLGTVSTGVNGYYYIATPTGTIGSSVLVYTVQDGGPDAAGAQNAVTLRTGLSGGNVSNLNVYGNWRLDEVDSSIASLSALQDIAATTVGSTYVGGLSFANWQIETAATTFALDQAISIGSGTLALSSNGTVTQTSSLSAGSLWLGGTGAFNLTNAGNQVGTVAAKAGSVNLADLGGLVIGSAGSARGVATTGANTMGQVQLQTTGDLTIAAAAKVSGTDPVLAAGGKFINSRGSDAVTATSGRWLVYAAAPTGNTFGNLNSNNTAIWNTAAGAAVSASGNRYVFAYQPTLTFTSQNALKTYGDNVMPTLAYTVSGYQAGVANAYLGDNAGTTFTGAPSLSTPNPLATQQLGAGTYTITVGAGDITVLNGYGLAFDSSGLFTVARRAVSVTADADQHKTYGDADAAFTYSVSDIGSGVALVGSLSREAGEDVGTYSIGQGSLTDANNVNYDITYVGADFTIGKRAITVTANANQGKAYGDADPTLIYSVSDLGSGEALVGSLARASGENVGSYAIAQGTLTNANNSNYDITFEGGTDFDIAKRVVTVTANAGQGKTYGDSDPSSYGYTYSGLGNGVALVGALDRAAGENAGSYAIGQGTLTDANNSNYDLIFEGGSFSIGKRSVTVTATAGQAKTYGNADPSSYSYTYSDLGSGAALVGTLDRAAGEDVGDYAIRRGTLTDANNLNYDITFAGADFSIGKRSVTVTAAAGQGKIYGNAGPTLGYSHSDLGSGVALVGSLERAAGENVGDYAIGQGSLTDTNNSNYEIAYVGADFTIGKRAVTVTANANQGKTYGDADPALTYSVSDLGSGEALIGSLDRAVGEDVGSYAIGQGSLTNANNANYDITFQDGADFAIGKRAVTVTVDASQGKIYGDADPSSYSYTYSDLGNGAVLAGALDRVAGENAGNYAIGQGTLTDDNNSNYDITFVSKDFDITRRAVTVTAGAGQHKTYGDADPALDYSHTDLGSGTALAGALDRASGENVGSYAIGQGTLTGANNSNYDITFVGADFSIGKRAVMVTAGAGQSKIYGNADPALGYSHTDLGSGEALVGDLDRAAGETVGSYAIGQGTLTDAANSNYDITFAGADFSIGKRAITVTADAQSRPSGMANPPLTYTIGGLGLASGDTLTGALATDAATASAPGTYAIEQGSLSASANYELTYVGANLVVQPANAMPTIDTASIVAFNAGAHGSGQPAPVFFTGLPAEGDTQTLVVDPRFDSAAFCQRMAEAASVCASALIQ